jgi:signal transduction histidine kinase
MIVLDGERDMTMTTTQDQALAEAIRRLGHDLTPRRVRELGGARALMAACGSPDPQRGALHLRAWLRLHP